MTSNNGEVVVAAPRRKALRRVAALLSEAVAALYLVVFFIQLPHMHETDNPAPVFVSLALVYVVGAVLLALRDLPWVHWSGAAVQVVIIGHFSSGSWWGVTPTKVWGSSWTCSGWRSPSRLRKCSFSVGWSSSHLAPLSCVAPSSPYDAASQ